MGRHTKKRGLIGAGTTPKGGVLGAATTRKRGNLNWFCKREGFSKLKLLLKKGGFGVFIYLLSLFLLVIAM